jgi:hypothetical protein
MQEAERIAGFGNHRRRIERGAQKDQRFSVGID